MKDHAALILRDNNNILFVQRSATKTTLPNIWAFPSGTVEDNEVIENTIIREAQEELGVDVKIEQTLAVTDLPEFNVRLHFIVCVSTSGQPSIQEPDEIQALRWMTFEEFFKEYSNTHIGHGLIWLRKNPDVWKPHFS